jgi:hypothetical protein
MNRLKVAWHDILQGKKNWTQNIDSQIRRNCVEYVLIIVVNTKELGTKLWQILRIILKLRNWKYLRNFAEWSDLLMNLIVSVITQCADPTHQTKFLWLLSGRCPIRISTGTRSILTQIFRSFPQVPQTGHEYFRLRPFRSLFATGQSFHTIF